MKVSRRELVALAIAAATPHPASPQPPAPPPEPASAVREANQRNSETLAKFEIPMAIEPAFQFKA